MAKARLVVMASNFGQKSQKKFSKKAKSNSKGPNKSLGQHWLRDRDILDQIAREAEIENGDFVLEIGPGLGTLTSSLLKFAGKNGEVLSVEFDENLASKLPAQFPGKNLTVRNVDFLEFDLSKLPKNYKVAANVPYYITSKIVEKLLTSQDKPSVAALLVQKEVAERICAEQGEMSILAIAAQIYAHAELGQIVPREFFTPPPKVDSQVVILRTRELNLLEEFNRAQNTEISENQLFRIIKAGFGAKRKKISKSLSANLAISKEQTAELLASCEISPDLRAQDLSISNWLNLAKAFFEK
ncbi:MAG: 16S rRNA (adenine(1518)-N(6)/adenine(1519)-N(6))-dimethyltransferase RsmA [bacterium]|nr:16S rRNA (adenine(1518)-N(6)/adenine(1519)-N(6))-dimethyltransferase RsmA [bacterium]